jgi:dolichyl-phosphate beta-glucosyltransferase
MNKTIIVVPCYNEARRLDVSAFEAWGTSSAFDLLFVDDGSSDETAAVLDALCRRMPGSACWLSLPRNQGKAEAVRLGMQRALDMGASVTGYLDADLATSLNEMARILKMLEELDKQVALASRIRMLGVDIKRLTMRHYLGRVFANVAAWALQMPVYDTQCGAKAFVRSRALEAALAEPFLSRWAFDVELLGRLAVGEPDVRGVAEDEFVEVPLRRWHDIPGYHWRFHDLAKMGLDLLRIQRDLVRRRRLCAACQLALLKTPQSQRNNDSLAMSKKYQAPEVEGQPQPIILANQR